MASLRRIDFRKNGLEGWLDWTTIIKLNIGVLTQLRSNKRGKVLIY